MRFRKKTNAEMVASALRVAARKEAEGCPSCAEAYLDVARLSGAAAEQVDATRRRLFKRAGALAGVGPTASLVDLGGMAGSALAAARGARSYLGGWVGNHVAAVGAVQATSDYRQAVADIAALGGVVTERGKLVFLPSSRPHPRLQDRYVVYQVFVRQGVEGLLQAAVDQHGASEAIATIGGLTLGWQAGRQVHRNEQATRRTLDLPRHRLLPLPGAKLEGDLAPSSVPAAHADFCTFVCNLIVGVGCALECALICIPPDVTGIGIPICNIGCSVFCSAAEGEIVCGNICI